MIVRLTCSFPKGSVRFVHKECDDGSHQYEDAQNGCDGVRIITRLTGEAMKKIRICERRPNG
jgi:hypothetical protein